MGSFLSYTFIKSFLSAENIYFIYRYRYNMEVDEEKIDTYNISVGFACGFVG